MMIRRGGMADQEAPKETTSIRGIDPSILFIIMAIHNEIGSDTPFVFF